MTEDPINELNRAVGRIEGKLDQVLTHDRRISSLERWRSWTIGASAVLVVLIAAIWELLTGVHGRH